MSEDTFARRRRPRPVAEMPPEELADGRDLAKAWLLELIAASSLQDAGGVPAAALTQEGPDLCAAVLAALGDEAALERLAPGGAADSLATRAAALSGAGDAVGVLTAMEALRRGAWDLLSPVAIEGPPTLTADLAARLAYVCAVVSAAAIAGLPGAAAAAAPAPAAVGSDTAMPDPAGAFAVHDLRAPAGDPLAGAIDRRVEGGRPFALLAIEVDDLERVVATQRGREVALALEAVENAVSDQLDAGDDLLRERVGRAWVLTGGAGRVLGERIADAVARTPPVHGVPLTVSVGLASYPEDGQAPEDLVARADEGVFAARAAGVRLA